MVLLPLIARRFITGEAVHRPVLGALTIVAVSGLTFSTVLLLAPPALITGVFGEQYADGSRYVLAIALVMTAAAVLYVHLMVALAAQDRTFVVVLTVAAVAHVAFLMLVARSPAVIVLVSAACVGAALLWREMTSRYATGPLVCPLVRERRRQSPGTAPENR